MLPEVRLVRVIRDDVTRMAGWLRDDEVNGWWYGKDKLGEPLHIGYSPEKILGASSEDWHEVFNGTDKKIFSVLTSDGEHIGEGQMVIEAPLREAQLFILIGRKDLWYWGFGTSALVHLLDLSFYTYSLHRAWVDIPDYNEPALHMCERIGFVLEGRLRDTHPKDGQWHDSLAMGLLSQEYAKRRTKLMGPEQVAVR